MATLKKSSRKKPAPSSAPDSLQAQAMRLSKHLSESAQQVWLAGVGAFGRAQAEGGKWFETLVKEGLSLEQSTRKLAGSRVEAVREAVENTVGQARERASDTWDRLEKVFEDRVQRALRRLDVPSREDLSTLLERVETLNAELRRLGGEPRTRKSTRKSASPPAAQTRATRSPSKSKPASRADQARTPAKRGTRKRSP